MKPIIRVFTIAVSLLVVSQFLYAQDASQPQEREDESIIRTSETPSAKIDAIKNELSRSDKKDLLKEVGLLRKLNAELEDYLPLLKERNNRLEADVENLQKEKDYIVNEMKNLKKLKGMTAKEDFEKLKKENKRLSMEVNKLEKSNDKLRADLKRAKPRQDGE